MPTEIEKTLMRYVTLLEGRLNKATAIIVKQDLSEDMMPDCERIIDRIYDRLVEVGEIKEHRPYYSIIEKSKRLRDYFGTGLEKILKTQH